MTRRSLFGIVATLPLVARRRTHYFDVNIYPRGGHEEVINQTKSLMAAHGLELWTSPDGRKFFQAYDKNGFIIRGLAVRLMKTCTLREANRIRRELYA